jgi:HEAT repeat protein
MRERFLDIPRMKVWHLLALVATVAAFLAVFRFRHEQEYPVSRTFREARSGSVEARRQAIFELGSADLTQPDLIPALLTALQDSDPLVRRFATRSLTTVMERATQRRIPKKEIVERTEEMKAGLARLLQDPDTKVRIEAAEALVPLDDRSEPLRDCLIKLAQGVAGEDRDTRRVSVTYLSKFCADLEVTALLVAAMADSDSGIREQAAYSLGAWGTLRVKGVPDSVIEALIKGFDDESPKVRAASVGTLSFMGSQARASIPAIIRRLDDPASEPRMAAAYALANFGMYAEPALPALRSLVDRDPNPNLRSAAKSSVSKIEARVQAFQEHTLPDLISELSEDDPARRRGASQALSEYGPRAQPAVSELRRLLSDEDADVRQAAAAALKEIEPAEASSRASEEPDR